MISLAGKVKPAAGVLSSAVDDETVLLDPKRGHYFSLNGSGSQIWNWIATADGATIEQLRNRLVAELDVERDVAEADLIELIGELVQHGLVCLHEP